jgi:2-polyprenyl-3-methyl-5-hydroxy-6-metoxy-1,4-benzoquinol methylase
VVTPTSLSTAQLVDLLLSYGDTNSVERITGVAPYLEQLAQAFGDREVRSVTAKELHAFHERVTPTAAARPVLALLGEKAGKWEAVYAPRAEGLVGPLQWESERPVQALVDLFERPDFRPRRVLELGCGDGVNAVFMAAQGCEVTAIDVSPTALRMAEAKRRAAGVEVSFLEGDVFEVAPASEKYDFIFDRAMLHHLQVFSFEDYKNLVADRLVDEGYFHLICHHVSARPTMLLDCLCGFVGILLGFLTGLLVEMGTGFTAEELREIFSDRFAFRSIELVPDDNDRPFLFVSSLMQRTA